MTNLQLFGVGAAVGGTVGLGLSLFVRYVVLPQMFAEQPTLQSLSTPTPAPAPFQPIPAPAPAQTGT
jgi:hypothetical protein